MKTVRVGRATTTLVVGVVALALVAPGAIAQTDPAPPATDLYHETLIAAIDDLNAYWGEKFEDVYPLEEWEPLTSDRVIAGRPGVPLPDCNIPMSYEENLAGNAYFCPRADYIAYDDAGLFPRFFTTYGRFSVAMVMAHEFGHVLQERAGGALDEKVILQELQADCFAGAYTRYVHRGRSTLSPLQGGERDRALAAFLEMRDRVGGNPDAPDAHGSAFDRTGAFLDGFEHGPRPCVDYFVDPPLIVEVPFTSAEDQASGGTLPADKLLAVTTDLLNDFYSNVEGDLEYVPLDWDDSFRFFRGDDPTTYLPCGGAAPTEQDVRNQVYWCLDGYIAWDYPFVNDVLYTSLGDLAVITVFSRAWATYVRRLRELGYDAGDPNHSLFGPDCYTGGVIGALARGELESDELTGQDVSITLSPGDLDEVIQAFLVQIESLGGASDVDITFLRLKAFRRGFFKGVSACTRYDKPYER